ncbi:MAG: glycosyltransferase family 2 protein [Candidatus Omnitrophica bacterium]|nr:glycosyltransferase family 2 protein [Candidatus Omnitrophota bacterium]
MIELSVIAPCYNEQNNIKDLVSKVLELFNKNIINGEIILVNDGSNDGSRIEIEKICRQFKNVVGVSHAENFGITEAWNSGLKSSRGKYIVTIDADLQYNPEDIIRLYQEIRSDKYDLVQGWRMEYKDDNLLRKFLSRSLSYLLNILFFTRMNDIKSGFVMYKREVFLDILKYRNKFRVFQHFFILCALKQGYMIKQVPIAFYPRIRGESFIKNPMFFSFKVLLDIPKAVLYFGILARKSIRRKSQCAA